MRLARLIIKSLGSEPEIPVQQVSGGKAKIINTDSDCIQQLEKHMEQIHQQSCIVQPDHFKHLTETMKGLLVVVAELKQEHIELRESQKEDAQMKVRVGNHTAIIAGLEEMYEGRLVEQQQESRERIKEIEGAYERQRRIIIALKQECQEKNTTIDNLNRQIAQLNDNIRSLQSQNEFLLSQLQKNQQELISFESVIKGNNAPPSHQFDVGKQKFEILFQSSVSEGIFKYLSINELVQLRLVNRKANYILRHEESMVRLLSTLTLSKVIKLRDQSVREVKQYEGLLEAFTEENVRQWALKYLYFKVRPGEYIGQVIADVTISEDMKRQQNPLATKPPERKRSVLSNFLFGEEKKEDRKFNIRDFEDEASIQRLTSRLEEFFEGTMRFNQKSNLQQFRERMTDQLRELKEATAQDNKTAALVVYTKFLYLEAQDLAHLSQSLFALLLKESRRANCLQSECEDLKEGSESVRKILVQLSEEKHRMEENSWKMEIEYVKHRNENIRLEDTIGNAESELTRLRQQNKELYNSCHQSEKKLEELFKQLKHYKTQFEGIHNLLTEGQTKQDDQISHRERSATEASSS